MSKEQTKQESPIVGDARNHFVKLITEGVPVYPYFSRHIEKVEEWAQKILRYYPDADEEVVLLGVQLHDIGQADGKYEEDHAIKSEAETVKFLTEKKYPKEKIKQVAHCVRSHRCRDVQPETIEAQILVAADSASHMTDFVYIEMLGQEHISAEDVLEKLERDYQDTQQWLPEELKQEIVPLYEAWKKLIEVFPR